MNTILKMGFDIEPVALFTYSTASARQIIVYIDKSEQAWDEFVQIVTNWFGREYADNKVTIQCQIEAPDSQEHVYDTIYITMWDNKLSIGLGVHFFEKYEDAMKNGHVIMAEHKRKK